MRNSVVSLALVGVMVVSGCATYNEYDLTPEERRLRAQEESFNNTVIEGAIFGALLGGLLGALTGQGKYVAIGAAAGGALGSGVGHQVATEQRKYANRESALNGMIRDTRVENRELRDTAATMKTVIERKEAQLIRLHAEVEAGQTTGDALRKQLAIAKDNRETMATILQKMRERQRLIAERVSRFRSEYGYTGSSALEAEAEVYKKSIDDMEEELRKYDEFLATVAPG